MRRTWLCIVAAALTETFTVGHQVSPHAKKAVETIGELRAIGVHDDDERTDPPPKVPGLLRTLNKELEALIVEDLNDSSRHTVPDKEEILEDLTAAGWEEQPRSKWAAYGEIRNIEFALKDGYKQTLLVVTTQLWLPNESNDPDAAVYIFQGEKRKWDLLLTAGADFNPTGESDETGLQYKLSPPDSDGRWFLVVAHLPPLSRSRPIALRYAALRPGTSPEKPVVLVSGRDRVDPFFEPPFRIEAGAYWFEVREGRKRKLDGELGTATVRYEISNYGARRVAPLADTPEDFLDQWTQAEWNDAKRWTKEGPSPGLEEWHGRLHSMAADSAEFESVQPCSKRGDGDPDWLIELNIDQRADPELGSDRLFVHVAARNGEFRLESVQKEHPARCAGRTALAPVTDPALP